MLRDYAFAGPAAVTTLTRPRHRDQRHRDQRHRDHQTATTSTGSARGQALAVSLPPRSFTVVEAPVAARRLA